MHIHEFPGALIKMQSLTESTWSGARKSPFLMNSLSDGFDAAGPRTTL